jgi:Protein of unknown function (DUF2911)
MKMNRSLASIITVCLTAVAATAQDKPRVSPTQTVKAQIDGADVSITYGAPFTKDPKTGEPRKIWGGLVPYGQVWRTGANEATTLTTTKDLEIGGTTVPAGSYTLFTLPEEKGATKLIINKQTGQWGTKYDQSQDLARVDLTKKTSAKQVDQFAMAITSESKGSHNLSMRWETTEFSVPIKAKP